MDKTEVDETHCIHNAGEFILVLCRRLIPELEKSGQITDIGVKDAEDCLELGLAYCSPKPTLQVMLMKMYELLTGIKEGGRVQ